MPAILRAVIVTLPQSIFRELAMTRVQKGASIRSACPPWRQSCLLLATPGKGYPKAVDQLEEHARARHI